ncbi:MAG: hypothetical protein ACRDXX_12210 [Stackebrandtia sp.]
MNDVQTEPEEARSTLNIDAERVSGMAGSAEDAADAVDGTEAIVREDTGPAEHGLDGWETARQISKIMVNWGTKSRACRDSLEYFADALRTTSTGLEGTDAQAAAGFVFPADNPVSLGEPPWPRPVSDDPSLDFPEPGGNNG